MVESKVSDQPTKDRLVLVLLKVWWQKLWFSSPQPEHLLVLCPPGSYVESPVREICSWNANAEQTWPSDMKTACSSASSRLPGLKQTDLCAAPAAYWPSFYSVSLLLNNQKRSIKAVNLETLSPSVRGSPWNCVSRLVKVVSAQLHVSCRECADDGNAFESRVHSDLLGVFSFDVSCPDVPAAHPGHHIPPHK